MPPKKWMVQYCWTSLTSDLWLCLVDQLQQLFPARPSTIKAARSERITEGDYSFCFTSNILSGYSRDGIGTYLEHPQNAKYCYLFRPLRQLASSKLPSIMKQIHNMAGCFQILKRLTCRAWRASSCTQTTSQTRPLESSKICTQLYVIRQSLLCNQFTLSQEVCDLLDMDDSL